MQRLFVLFVILILSLSACSPASPKMAPRLPLTDEQRDELYNRLEVESGVAFYSADGVTVTASCSLEVASWKLSLLAEAYALQNDMSYVTDTSELPLEGNEDYYLAHLVTTEDFLFEFRLTGSADTIDLDIRIPESSGVLIVPRGCILNGIVKDTTLFKGSEPESGHFIITAQNADFDKLALFDLCLENISSMAWLLTAINEETKEMRDFILAASFPVAEEWTGLTVSPSFSADSGIVMWIARQDDAAYLCTFNGSDGKISSDIAVSVAEGNLISDIYTLNVSSGECSYIFLGYGLEGTKICLGDALLHSER